MGDSDGLAVAIGIIAAVAIGAAIGMALLQVHCPTCGAVFGRPPGPSATCPKCGTYFRVN